MNSLKATKMVSASEEVVSETGSDQWIEPAEPISTYMTIAVPPRSGVTKNLYQFTQLRD